MSSLSNTEQVGIVNESWQRCQQFGLKPTDAIDDQMVAGKQLNEVLKKNENLIRHTVGIFEKLFPLIRQTGHVAALVDNTGTVIHTAGDPGFEDQARMVQLQVGANWQERKKGTNAMGVALVEQEPVRIHGNQHFYISNRFLTCAASPIFTPSGELVGVINISGSKELYNPHTLSLVSMIADNLQNRFLLEQAKHEHIVTLKELEHTANSHPLPLLSLDNEHRIIRANQAARRVLGKNCIGQPFTEREGFVIETVSDHTRKIWRSVAIYKQHHKERQRLHTFRDITGSCPSIRRVKTFAEKAASTDFPVLITGETGTGKELLAQSIHTASSRAEHPFIAVNCGAIPESLVESEWFGYERGAFTGARREGSVGKFEAANLGTIFLDEVGDMSPRAQVALLRVLQEREITRVGGVKSKPIDVRIIAATNKHLTDLIKQGQFRSDLYYRLKGIELTLPPLRERSDIIQLAEYLLNKMARPALNLSKEAQNKLLSHDWPGNIRELNSVLVQASFLADGEEIRPEHLQLEHADARPQPDGFLSLKDAEIAAIKKSLQTTGWNISKAAERLQIGRNTLYRKMKEYNIR